jgi:hypothetical protein
MNEITRKFILRNKKVINYARPKFNFSGGATPPPKKEGMFAKLKQFGKFGLIFYFTYWAATGIGFYILFKNKILDMDKAISWTEKMGLNKIVDIRKLKDKLGEEYSTVVVAYAVNSLFEIVRLPTTIAFLTFWVKVIKKK